MRKIINLNKNWHFCIKDKYDEMIDIPHTWNAIDGQDGGNDYLRALGIYDKKFDTPQFDHHGERVYIQFDGVNSESEVYINGVEIIRHDGGYSTFRKDITEVLKTYGEQNEIIVKVDNRPNKTVYPQKADFTFYGGIYRDVSLIIVKNRHFDMDYYGGRGVQITAKPVDSYKNADFLVRTWANCKDAVVEVEVRDQEGVIITTETSKGAQGTGDGYDDSLINKNPGASVPCDDHYKSFETSVRLFIKDVHLWQGIKDPYLYSVVVRLISEGDIQDEIVTRVGVRDFKCDPKRGFFLNGHSYPLHGVSRHQDRKGIGNALTPEMHKEDINLICEIGANTIRLAHYQHSQCFYDLCDEKGMIVWAEIPYISEHMPLGKSNTINQMKELIVQNYNHPSIVCWGISNEITISTREPADMLDNHKILNDLCHMMDKTRFTTLACYAMCGPFNRVAHITDTVSWNLYLGWYVPGLWLNDLWIRFFHAVYPKRCLGYSEYGCEGMPNLHSDRPRRGDHTEEYQAIYHEYMLECFERNPFLWATHVWNMFDFAADARNQGGDPGMNHKGLVTFDRKIRKDSFYLYKAYWSDEPFVHITSKRFRDRTSNEIKIKVYTNQTEVELYMDGTKVDVKKGKHVIVFNVPLDRSYGRSHEYKVISGECCDTATFRRVQYDNPEYKLNDNGDKGANWTNAG